MTRIVLTGYFHRGNLGDDAMIEGLEDWLRSRLPNCFIERASFPPSSALTRLPGFVRTLRSADWVVFAGGTNFHDLYGPKSWRLLAQMTAAFGLARQGGTRIAYAGIGVGPLRTAPGRMLTRQLLSLSQSTTVRDSESLRVAETVRPGTALLGFDLALLARPVEERDCVALTSTASSSRRLGVSLVAHHAMFGDGDAKDCVMANSLARALFAQHESGRIDAVEVYPFSRDGVYADVAISRYLCSLLEPSLPVELVDCSSPQVVRSRMKRLTGFIGARYHSILLAFEAGLPIVPLLYHEKCRALAVELGLPADAAIDAADFTDSSRFASALDLMTTGADAFRASQTVEAMREKAHQTAQVLVSAIQGGSSDETDEGTVSPALPGLRRAA